MIGYIIGLAGMWLFTDGVFSIIVYHRFLKSGNSWKFDHSIRVIRILIGVGLMIIGGQGI